jgi:hypothetical protein
VNSVVVWELDKHTCGSLQNLVIACRWTKLSTLDVQCLLNHNQRHVNIMSCVKQRCTTVKDTIIKHYQSLSATMCDFGFMLSR